MKLQARVTQVEAGTWTWSLESVAPSGTETVIANGAVAKATASAAEADLRDLLSALDAAGITAHGIRVVEQVAYVAP